MLKFQTQVAYSKGIDKHCRPRSDYFLRSSLIRVLPVCYSEKHFVKSSLNKENRTKIVFEILEQLPSVTVILVTLSKGTIDL